MSHPLLPAILEPPERDPLERFWRLEPDARALVAVAVCILILLLGVKGWISAAVYALALAPGVLVVRSVVRHHPGAAQDGALARSALAGLLFTLLILEYEELVDLCVSLITVTVPKRRSLTDAHHTFEEPLLVCRERARRCQEPTLCKP